MSEQAESLACRKPGNFLLLEKTSLAYIFLPWVLFLFGWVKPLFAFPILLVLLAGLWKADRMLSRQEEKGGEEGISSFKSIGARENIRRVLFAIVVFLALFYVVLVSGIGGFGPQRDEDFGKHNSFLRDLTELPWPLWYAETGPQNTPGHLVTYMAVYLPAAFAGKLFGWAGANWVLVLWVTTGFFLSVQWFLRLVGKSSLWYVLFFVFFGGLDLFGWPMLYGLADGMRDMAKALYLDFWTLDATLRKPSADMLNHVLFLYPSNMTLLFAGFHHIMPGWVIVLMTLDQCVRHRSMGLIGLLWAAASIGSAFVALGMVPFLLLGVWQLRLKDAFNALNLVVAPLLLLVSALFFLSNNAEYVRGWLWNFLDPVQVFPFLLFVFLIEFAAYAAVCPALFDDEFTRPWRAWWILALICLLMLPLYRIGAASDFPTKAFIPSLIVLQVVLARSIATARKDWQKYASRCLVLLLIAGAANGVRTVARNAVEKLSLQPVPIEQVLHINQLGPKHIAAQLFSDGNSFFWRSLARKPSQTGDREP